MKRCKKIFTLISLVFILGLQTIMASDFQVHISLNQETGVVKIIGSGKREQAITIQVVDPFGSLDYIDQTNSDEKGKFNFQYKTTGPEGEYKVKIGGQEAGSFVYTKSEDPKFEDPKPEDTRPVTPKGAEIIQNRDGSVLIQQSYSLDRSGKVAQVVLNEGDFQKALEKAKSDAKNQKKIVLEVPKVSGATEYIQRLPLQAVALDKGNHKIEIVTETATIELSNNTFSNLSLGIAEYIDVTIAKMATRNTSDRRGVEVQVIANGRKIEIENRNVFAKVSIPFQPSLGENTEFLSIIHVDQWGNRIPVYNGRYNTTTQKIDFMTNYFGQYIISYTHKKFVDIDGYQWAKHPIEVLASKGIINGTSEINETFNPGANITRADFIILLVKTLDLQAFVNSQFADVNPQDYYYEQVGIAKTLGIAVGGGNNKFNPRETITREDMMTLTARAMDIAGVSIKSRDHSPLNSFVDQGHIASYARDSISTLVESGLILGNTNKEINPKQYAKRAEVASFLYKLYNFQP